MLPIRNRTTHSDVALILPDALQIDNTAAVDGLPLLRAKLAVAPTALLRVVIQVRNSAGIPIVAGRATIAAGDTTLLCADLRPVGIDAYAHKSSAERAQIAARIWSRRSYATVQILS